MIYRTKITNKSGQDLRRLSGLSNRKHQFDIADGESIIIPSKDKYGLLSRYEEIIFQRGKSVYERRPGSDVVTETILPGKVKCVVRKNWTEPARKFPVVNFLNLGGAQMETIYLDCFDMSEKLMLPLGIPIFASVPPYADAAKFREYIIHEPELDEVDGELVPNHEMKGKRSEQELARLSKLYNDWKESEKNRIKVM